MKQIFVIAILIGLITGSCCATTNEPVDTTSPVITQVAATEISQTGATVSWVTDEPCSSQVEYGTDILYAASTDIRTTLTTEHSFTLSGLITETTYHYRVKSSDVSGNETVSEDHMFITDNVYMTSYEVVFDSTWSAITHPEDFPSSPHFSGLIGATHNASVLIWREGELASAGIKSMAETGSKDPLNTEIDEAITSGKAYSKLSGGSIPVSPGDVSLAFDIHEDYPLVSLVSMIAPSPDWFIGVPSISLLENGQWVDSKVIDLYAYDSGTDSGVSYVSPNSVTNPPINIYMIEVAPFLVDDVVSPLGTFTFTRQ